MKSAVVLLSGGMDSVAALHWALGRYQAVRAIGFDYDQPHRNAELAYADAVAARRGVFFKVIPLGPSLDTGLGLLGEILDHVDGGGVNPAFVPNRNSIMLNTAATHACAWFPSGVIDLVFAPHHDDAVGFPDCRPEYLAKLAEVIALGCDRDVDVITPWIELSKGGILAAIHDNPSAVSDVQRSWSCYRGLVSGPCGSCSACVVRSRAFAAAGLVDLSAPLQMGAPA